MIRSAFFEFRKFSVRIAPIYHRNPRLVIFAPNGRRFGYVEKDLNDVFHVYSDMQPAKDLFYIQNHSPTQAEFVRKTREGKLIYSRGPRWSTVSGTEITGNICEIGAMFHWDWELLGPSGQEIARLVARFQGWKHLLLSGVRYKVLSNQESVGFVGEQFYPFGLRLHAEIFDNAPATFDNGLLLAAMIVTIFLQKNLLPGFIAFPGIDESETMQGRAIH